MGDWVQRACIECGLLEPVELPDPLVGGAYREAPPPSKRLTCPRCGMQTYDPADPEDRLILKGALEMRDDNAQKGAAWPAVVLGWFFGVLALPVTITMLLVARKRARSREPSGMDALRQLLKD